MLVRLQKALAEAGVASRRASEQLIASGHVTVNGDVVQTLGAKVDPAKDVIAVDGQTVRARRKLYIALHKPLGFLCTKSDPEERRVVAQLLPKEWGNLYPVGRLDHDTEGLLFLTNDGEFCLKLTHPRYGIRKRYRVRVAGKAEGEILGRLTRGIVDQGEKLHAEKAELISATHSHSVLELELAEGKYREVRRLMEGLGFEVEGLIRTQIGPIRLGELPVGKWRVLTPAEVAALVALSAAATPQKPAVKGRKTVRPRTPRAPDTRGPRPFRERPSKHIVRSGVDRRRS